MNGSNAGHNPHYSLRSTATDLLSNILGVRGCSKPMTVPSKFQWAAGLR